MTTSNNTSWQLERDDLIASAYRKIGYLAEGQTLSTEALANGVEALNGVVSLLAIQGMPLWKRTTTAYSPSTISQVYTIPSAIKVVQVVLKDLTGGSQYDLIEKSLYDFNRLPTNSPGTPVHYTYQPGIEDGTLSIWPILSDATSATNKQILVVYQKEFDGYFSSTDTPDFPPYWTMGVLYQLSCTLAPESGTPLADRELLLKETSAYIKMASDYGDEDGSLYIMPDYHGKKM